MLFVNNTVLFENNIDINNTVSFNFRPVRSIHGYRMKVLINGNNAGEIAITDDPRNKLNFQIVNKGRNKKEDNAILLCYYIGIACYSDMLFFIQNPAASKIFTDRVYKKLDLIRQLTESNIIKNSDNIKDACMEFLHQNMDFILQSFLLSRKNNFDIFISNIPREYSLGISISIIYYIYSIIKEVN